VDLHFLPSQKCGTGGARVLLLIPPVRTFQLLSFSNTLATRGVRRVYETYRNDALLSIHHKTSPERVRTALNSSLSTLGVPTLRRTQTQSPRRKRPGYLKSSNTQVARLRFRSLTRLTVSLCRIRRLHHTCSCLHCSTIGSPSTGPPLMMISV
jgi:hypothetical protein